MMAIPPKVDIIGTGISDVTVRVAVGLVLEPPGDGLSVAVCNVHTIMTARRESEVHDAVVRADLATPDGMPVVWALDALQPGTHERVDGYRLFDATMTSGLEASTRHFFYGSTVSTLAMLVETARRQYPGVMIVGSLSPPFRPQTSGEIDDDLGAIRACRPDIVWVGLGMPKQEIWMQTAKPALPGVAIVGVGAVFDWVAGSVPKAPEWMQRCGLEWLYRLGREPRRLWRRYAWNNPAYLVLLAAQIARERWSRARS